MLKITLDVGRVNKVMRIKFGLIVRSDPNPKHNFFQVESKFKYMGNDYYKLSPNPFITLDISKGGEKNEQWNVNQIVNFNRIKVFEFLKKLKQFLYQYRQYKNLYYYENQVLKINQTVAKNLFLDLVTTSKHIRMIPCVVPGEQEEEYYEGSIFAVNSMDNFCYLTYDEMEYLYYELSHINMNEMSILLMRMVYDMEKNEKIEEKEITQRVTTKQEEEEEESIDSSRIVHLERHSEMDDV